MRILQVEKYYWPQGGASRYALELSRLLTQAGHEVVPFAVQDKRNLHSDYQKYFAKSFDFTEARSAGWWTKLRALGTVFYSWEAERQLNRLLDNEKIKLAHLHNIYHQLSPSILPVLKERGIPIVMTLHDFNLLSPSYNLFHHGEIHEEEARGWYLSCVKNKCFKNSRLLSAVVTAEMIFHHKIKRYYERYVDLFLAPSQFVKDKFIAYGWDEKKIKHLPLPVVAPKASSSKAGSYVGYVGRLSEEKGLLVLLETARRTRDIHYKIIGTGPMEALLKQKAKEWGLYNVEFMGYQTGKALTEAIAEAKFLVAPSICYENYPLSVLEAKAQSKIVLGSNTGGIPEQLPKELLFKRGSVGELEQKIRYWFSAPADKITALGKQLRQEVLDVNDPAKHIAALEKVYLELL